VDAWRRALGDPSQVERDPAVAASNQWTFKVWLEDGDFTFEMGMTASEIKTRRVLQHFVSGDDVHYVMSHWPDMHALSSLPVLWLAAYGPWGRTSYGACCSRLCLATL
jgi:hypothetical protein